MSVFDISTFDMNTVGAAFLWCAIQVTLFAAVGLTIYSLARRVSLHSGAAVVTGSLLIVLALSAMALSPWPNWTPIATHTEERPTEVEPVETVAIETTAPPPSARLMDNGQTPVNTVPIGREGDSPESDEAASDGGAIPWAPLARTLWDELHETPARPVASGVTPLAEQAWAWRAFMAIAFLSATTLGVLRFVVGWLAVGRLRRRSHLLRDAELTELVDVLQAELGCTQPVALRESSALVTAATVGWRRPVILLPIQWRNWSKLQRQAVLAHELAHIRRGDFLTYMLARIGLAIHYYHPLVHWLVGRLRLEQELVVDADAAALLGGRRAYLITLAELALAQPSHRLGWPARTFLPTRGMFLRRIEMLRNKRQLESSSSARARLARWCMVSVLVVAGIAAAGLRGVAEDVGQDGGGLSGQAGVAEPVSAKAKAPAAIEFRLVENEPGEGLAKVLLPTDKKTVYLHPRAVLTQEHVAGAGLGVDNNGRPGVNMEFTKAGGRILAKVTSENIGKKLAILVEGKVISAPTIRTKIGTRVLIAASPAEVKRIVEIVCAATGAAKPIPARTDPRPGARRPGVVLSSDDSKATGKDPTPTYSDNRKPSGKDTAAKPRPLDSIVWDNPRRGWQVGAKLLSTGDQFKVGDSVVVQYLLKNVTTERRTVVLRQIESTHPTLGGDNRISVNISGSSENRHQHTLAPGAIMEKRQYRIALNTQGILPGVYTLDTQPVFWQVNEEQPDIGTGIGRHVPIRFEVSDPARETYLAYSKPPLVENPAETIYWGKRVGGLTVGMRLPKGRMRWTNESRIGGELFIRNVSWQSISLTYQVPPTEEWNMHVQTKDGKAVQLDRVWVHFIRRAVTRSLTIKPGEQVFLTDQRQVHGPTIQVTKAARPLKAGEPARLTTKQGSYIWRAYITVTQKKAPDLTMIIGSGAVPFEIVSAAEPPNEIGAIKATTRPTTQPTRRVAVTVRQSPQPRFDAVLWRDEREEEKLAEFDKLDNKILLANGMPYWYCDAKLDARFAVTPPHEYVVRLELIDKKGNVMAGDDVELTPTGISTKPLQPIARTLKFRLTPRHKQADAADFWGYRLTVVATRIAPSAT